MKQLLLLLFVSSISISYSQETDTPKNNTDKGRKRVTFVTTFDASNARKYGFYLDGYVVNISRERAEEINGKKIKVKGKVRVEKGIKNNSPVRQGAYTDIKYIDRPSIKIIDN